MSGSHIVSLENTGTSWKICFQNGNTATADLIIGADGANSKIRPFVTPIRPFYSGVTFLTGNIPASEQNAPQLHTLLKGGKISAMGDSKTIFLSAKGDGSMDFYISWKAAADWATASGIDFKDRKQVLAWFKTAFAHWDDRWLELFEHEHTTYMPRPLNSMPLDQSWEAHSNITLLGDAAHLLPPNGEGVNTAMLDALELSELLTNETAPDVKSAIAQYEEQLFARFAEEGKVTLEMMDWTYSPDGLKTMVEMMHELPG